MRVRRSGWAGAVVLALAGALAGCLEWQQPTEVRRVNVSRYVSAVTSVDGSVRAVLRDGAPPTTGGVNITADLPGVVIIGGTVQTTVRSAAAFNRITIAVPDVDGYWELTLPTAAPEQDILIVFGQEAPTPVFTVRIAGGGSGGTGQPVDRSVSLLTVGTGEVQVNVTWNSRADVDLYLVDPRDEEIYYANRRSGTGGELDLDSNAACGTDGPRAENIFWRSGLIPPRGEYVVRVNYWSACGAARTDYVITVNVRGKAPQTFTGFFTGPGVGGGQGAGRQVTRFVN